MLWWMILVAAIVIFWLVGVDRPRLKVTFKDGEISKVKGHLPPAFKHNCEDIAHRTPFSGELKVYSTRNGAKLVFAKGVPSKVQQRIRNVFPHQGFRKTNPQKSA